MATNQEVIKTFDRLIEKAGNYRAVRDTMAAAEEMAADPDFRVEREAITRQAETADRLAQDYTVELVLRNIPAEQLQSNPSTQAVAPEIMAARQHLNILEPNNEGTRRQLLRAAENANPNEDASASQNAAYDRFSLATAYVALRQNIGLERDRVPNVITATETATRELSTNLQNARLVVDDLVVATTYEIRGNELAQAVEWDDYSSRYLARARALDHEIEIGPRDPTLDRLLTEQTQREATNATRFRDTEADLNPSPTRRQRTETAVPIPSFQPLPELEGQSDDGSAQFDTHSLQTQPGSLDERPRGRSRSNSSDGFEL